MFTTCLSRYYSNFQSMLGFIDTFSQSLLCSLSFFNYLLCAPCVYFFLLSCSAHTPFLSICFLDFLLDPSLPFSSVVYFLSCSVCTASLCICIFAFLPHHRIHYSISFFAVLLHRYFHLRLGLIVNRCLVLVLHTW